MRKPKKIKPTADRLRELLSYSPDTGIFTWKVSNGRRVCGTIAGAINRQGYISIGIDRDVLLAHRIAWCIMTGNYPTNLLDHINRIKTDNRFANLREATHSQNHQNMTVRRDSSCGIRGIYHHHTGGWVARITVNKKHMYLGYFKTAEEARSVRLEAEKRYFTHASTHP